jgi:acetolactate decarboxylase
MRRTPEPKISHRTPRLVLHIPAELASRLRARRKQTGQAVSAIVIDALSRFLGEGDESIYQSSTVGALLDGVNEGEMTIGELKTHGDFGLGTFDDLDGEMIELEGKVYRVGSDGAAHPVADSERTPFATVSFFHPDIVAEKNLPMSYLDLLESIGAMMPSKNLFHAIKVTGSFEYLKTRAVAKQEKSAGLLHATQTQPTFEFRDVRGTIAGFFTPEYMGGVNVPGFHLHFLTEDRAHGGHLLECRTLAVKIEIHETPEFELGLPETVEFMHADLAKDRGADLKKAEE